MTCFMGNNFLKLQGAYVKYPVSVTFVNCIMIK